MEAVLSSENKTAEFLKSLEMTENKVSIPELNRKIEEAKLRLASTPLPNKKQEDWKYSKIAPFLTKNYKESRSNDSIDLSRFQTTEIKSNLLVFVNGYFRDDLSSITETQEGVIIQNMTEAVDLFKQDIEEHFASGSKPSFFIDLNTVYHSNGVFIKVDENVIGETPIHLLHILSGDNTISQSRNLILLGKNSKLEVVESQFEVDSKDSLSNHVSEYFVGENALLNYTLIEKGSENALIHSNYFIQKDFSKINSNVFSLKNKLIRNNHYARIDGKDTETRLNGSFMPSEGEQVDNRTMLDHRNVRGFSEEVYKGILFEKSNAVFNGKIFVDQKAQQTNAYLNNSNILMDDSSRMHSKPELEIYADDVKCSHGSATGDFDSEAQFYLQARGIGIDKARNMLIHAFMDEVASKIENSEVENIMKGFLDSRMIELDK